MSLDAALQYTFLNEGHYSDDVHDHGGATSQYGITREELSRWRKQPVSKDDVRLMPGSEAKAIYEAWYWKPLGCDKIMSPAIGTCMFDIGVVRGIGVPPKYAQIVCNKISTGLLLTVDGHIGPKTIATINGLISPAQFVKEFSALAESGFRSIVEHNPSQRVFLKGWVNRAHRLLTLA
ncbi:MAG: glycoside hydrolase family 108 protein [Bdellovibrionales bacterium]